MTELATTSPAALAPALTETGNGTDLAAWVNDLGNAYTLAERICRTPFAPKDFQGKPEAAAVAILHGKSLGLDPLASMSSIFVVSGRPGLYAKAMHAIVLAAGHQVWVESESAQEVVVKGKRRGQETVSTSRWTPERAQAAGYFSNAKYRTEPIAMLRARAIGDVCRVVAPDVLAGLAYNEADVAVMELEDMGETPAPATAAPKARVQRQRRQAPAPVAPAAVQEAPRDETPVDDEADQLAEQADTVTGELPEADPGVSEEATCTPEQQKALGEALKAAGYATRAVMMSKVTDMVGRGVESSKELTEAEAIDLTARLWDEADANQPAETEPAA